MTKTYAKHGDPNYNSKTAAGCEADGEPVFTLRAQDAHAAETVRYWADLVSMTAMKSGRSYPAISHSALDIADQMDAWPEKKEPD